MRKNVFGRRLRRTTNQRKGLFRSLMRSLVLEGRIKTTEAKAKSVKAEIEKLVTKAKNSGEKARRDILKYLPHDDVVSKIISEIAPLYKTRPGGYTRIIRLSSRKKDNAPMVMMEWVESGAVTGESAVSKTVKTEKKVKTPKTSKTPKKEKAVRKSPAARRKLKTAKTEKRQAK